MDVFVYNLELRNLQEEPNVSQNPDPNRRMLLIHLFTLQNGKEISVRLIVPQTYYDNMRKNHFIQVDTAFYDILCCAFPDCEVVPTNTGPGLNYTFDSWGLLPQN